MHVELFMYQSDEYRFVLYVPNTFIIYILIWQDYGDCKYGPSNFISLCLPRIIFVLTYLIMILEKTETCSIQVR
jgi:hypothetical protein